MKLTYKNKNLTNDEKRAIEDRKREMIIDQGGCCYSCPSEFVGQIRPEMSHILNKSKANIELFGYEVIHHRLNMHICCSKCNSGIMINRSKKVLVGQHLIPIKEDLKLQGYDVEKLEKQIDNLLNGLEP